MTGIESLRRHHNQPTDQPTEYVCGFLFNDQFGTSIALIEKKYPPWQAGYLNGVGGGIEGDETPMRAMAREFQQEAGVAIDSWTHFCTLRTVEARIHWFVMHVDCPVELCSPTAEQVRWYLVEDLHRWDLIPNTRWLIVMAMLGPDGILGNVWPYDIWEPSEGPK